MRKGRNAAGVALAVLLLTATAVAVASAASSSVVAAATAGVKKYSATPAPVSVPAVDKKIPKGKVIAVITCPSPTCTSATNASIAGAKDVGWQTRTFENPLTPEGYVAVWQQVLETKPAGIIVISVFPDTLIASEFATAKADHIPVVELVSADSDTPTKAGPLIAEYSNIHQFAFAGKLLAEWVVSNSAGKLANAGGDPVVAFMMDPSLATSLGAVQTSFDNEISAAGGKVDEIQVSQLNAGKTIPGQIVSYVQSHPDLKYLVGVNCDILLGVPQALAAAGVRHNVKILCRATQTSDIPEIKSGLINVTTNEENSAIGWRAVDALIRHFVGEPVWDPAPAGSMQLATKATTFQVSGGSTATPGVPGAFLKAWGVK